MPHVPFLRRLLGAVAASAVLFGSAHAAAPMVKTQAPGYYRVMLGDFEVTALSDGTVALPMDKVLTDTTPAQVKSAFANVFMPTSVETSVNAYLVNTGAKLVLIDTGAASLFGPTLGKLLVNLKAAGYQPEQVDEVYITHLHADHVGGLMNGTALAFPNAVVRADRRDADYWLSAANLDQAAAADKGFFQGAMASLNPYIAAGKFKPIDAAGADTELVAGVKAVATPGHTPGHNLYKIESQGQTLMLWGDLIHAAAIQFDAPTVTMVYDIDTKAAVAQRQRAFAEAAAKGYLVGASHLTFPGLGHLRTQGKGYAWVPLNYSSLK